MIQCSWDEGLNVVVPSWVLIIAVLYTGFQYRELRSIKAYTDENALEEHPKLVGKAAHLDIKKVSEFFKGRDSLMVFKPTKWESFLSLVESLCLLGAMSSVLCHMKIQHFNAPDFVVIATFIYLLGVAVLRFLHTNLSEKSQKIQRHLFLNSLVLYHVLVILQIFQILYLWDFQLSEEQKYNFSSLLWKLALLLVIYFKRYQFEDRLYVSKDNAAPCLEPITSIYSRMTFSWTNDLFKLASTLALNVNDIWGLTAPDQSLNIVKDFEAIHNNSENNLTVSLALYLRTTFLYQLCCGVVCSLLTFAPSLLLKLILEYVEDPQSHSLAKTWFMLSLMFIMKIFESISGAFGLYLGKRLDIRLRTLLISEIYCKVLAVNASSLKRAGSIINLVSLDAYNIGNTLGYVSTVPVSILMIVIAISLLYQYLGWSSLIGAMILVVLIPINHRTAAKIAASQKAVLKTSDVRISQLTEVFNNISTIKNFAWEDKFYKEVITTRNQEVKSLKQKSLFMSLQSLLVSITPTLVTFGAFYCFTVFEKQDLTPSIAFTSLTLFNLLRQPLIDLAAWSSDIYQSWISFQRIQDFLNEKDTYKYNLYEGSTDTEKLGFENLSFSWGTGQFELHNLNINFQINALNVIIGATGSGKTSLLLALLGEMKLINSGRVWLPGSNTVSELVVDPVSGLRDSVSYCSQSPWLINGSIKDNITFSSEYDKDRYCAVLTACALNEDLTLLSDETEIGESGAVLSGGQKQRLSLARAIYSRSRFLILDDCLSAVDAHTASWIYNNCLTGPLMEGRTCILSSHNVSLATQNAGWVVLLDHGAVVEQGSVNDLIETGVLTKNKLEFADSDTDRENSKIPTPRSTKLMEEESKEEGSIPWTLYKYYFKCVGGPLVWILIITLYLVSQLAFISQTLWLRQWTAEKDSSGNRSGFYYIGVYLSIGTIFSLISTIRVYFVSIKGLGASNTIFERAYVRLLHSVARFFDITPKGRIINRFSKDVQAIDQELIKYGETALMYLTHCISTIIMICIVTPKFLLFGWVIIVCYYMLGGTYLRLSRQLKRLDSITRSPIYSHFQETLKGVITIRAYCEELRYILQNLARLDLNNKMYYYLWISNRWLSVRTDAVGALILLFSGGFILLKLDALDAGLAGLSMTYAMTFNTYMVWLIRAYLSVEMSMNSVERLGEYLSIEQEPAYELESDDLITKWPTNGEIKVQNLSLRYHKSLKPVIQSVSFAIKADEKVAIVGRTGAGKSTIISAFLRFFESDPGSKILIDDVDIKKVGLKKLRNAISIIPQNSTLFHGSIRTNLDPFKTFKDSQVIEVLRSVNLLENVEDPVKFLDADVQENGSNFSVGQKQLLCIARSLLRDSKIVLLDEATSSIDHKTDSLIQNAVRKNFKNKTVITVAHRLRTIIDYDRVLVLDKGHLVEFDTPKKLLLDRQSLFYKLCENSGELDVLKAELK